MSNAIVMTCQAPIQNAFTLLNKYIEICPENIWIEKNGGWPIWQQVYHTLAAFDFFTGPVGTPSQWPFGIDVAQLRVVSDKTFAKEEAKKLSAEAKVRVELYIAGLSDATLTATVPHLSKIMGYDVTHGMVLSMLGSHILYHIGSCDSALRDHGLEGTF